MHSINGVIDRGNRMMKDKFGSHRRLLEDFDDEYVFSIGKAKSGLAFHQHTQSYNELIHGEKRWYLYAPGAIPKEGFSPWETHIEWLDVVSPSLAQKDRPLEVTQRPGEVLYIPEGWYHATVSLSDLTVAITQQTNHASEDGFYDYTMIGTEAMKERRYEKALNYFSRALSLCYDANILRKIGEAYEKLGNFVQAQRLFLMSIERNYRHPASYIDLIGILIDNKDSRRAEEILELADRHGVILPTLEKYRVGLLVNYMEYD